MTVGKDGILTKKIENIPYGGHITSALHRFSGNSDHAENAI